jgi:hypothetical protein
MLPKSVAVLPCQLGWRTLLKCNKTNHACLPAYLQTHTHTHTHTHIRIYIHTYILVGCQWSSDHWVDDGGGGGVDLLLMYVCMYMEYYVFVEVPLVSCTLHVREYVGTSKRSCARVHSSSHLREIAKKYCIRRVLYVGTTESMSVP